MATNALATTVSEVIDRLGLTHESAIRPRIVTLSGVVDRGESYSAETEQAATARRRLHMR